MPTRNPITVERLVGVLRRSQTPKIIVEGETEHHGLLAIALDRPISSRLFDKLRTDLHAKLEEQKPEMASQTSVS